MCNHDDSVALSMNVAKFLHNDMTTAAVEVTSGLVGENDRWIGDEAARNGDALLLAAGELIGHIVFTFAKMEAFKDFVGFFETTDFVVTGIN